MGRVDKLVFIILFSYFLITKFMINDKSFLIKLYHTAKALIKRLMFNAVAERRHSSVAR